MSDSASSPKVTEGDYAWHVPGGAAVKTHYYMHHPTDTTTTESKIPLLILHGGPGIPGVYLSTLSKLHSHRPVIFYDQLGCARSTRLPEKMGDEAFWTVDLFTRELDGVIAHLGLTEGGRQFDLFGHSWGAMLAATYAAANPTGSLSPRKLILASGLASMADWISEVNRLRRTMPREVQDVLDRCERNGTTDSKEYEEAVGHFYSLFMIKMDPMPADLAKAFELMGQDPTVYFTMFGRNEFSCNGPLKTWDMTSDLHKIVIPTLMTNGWYDEATDVVQRPFFHSIPRVKWVQFADSAHMAHIEEEERYLQVVEDFLSAKAV
ncbi:hypothetical protein EUX98_g2301 [Antrodiella citrinella]|uniref:AB hydrolase-1 domain-containing protein n=1 Tax=Antrodiella citrinella TaxID=2447956 RepID=A0A4S4N7I4_9APHY|nr:hypothetical protein EUX98_g2301 [Antrodiella citrinella]